MLFHSFEFLVFLPVVFLFYWLVFRGRRGQNLLVVVASYVFYGWWDWRFLLLIAFTSLCGFFSGLLMEHWEGHRRRRRAVSAANIVVNLAVLGVFKYFNFFVENLNALLGMASWHLDWATMHVVLPVGISFYTFQALSYSIDVYRRELPATHDVVEFFAYISFFPQLVAGPIERATNLLPQFQRDRTFDYSRAVDGLRQMLWGFVKKVVVADNCAVAVNQIWDASADAPGLLLWMGAVLFTFQIYCDFSGYSDIAIGCARLFGFDLMRNFRYPYFSRSLPEFWRRWHISLMTWLRDYIYIPLGGSREGRMKTIRNTLLVFAVSGLWHGANWTFVTWGLYHALLVSVFVVVGWRGKADSPVSSDGIGSRLIAFGQYALTFLLVVVGWVIFRSTSVAEAGAYLGHMFYLDTLPDIASVTVGKQALLWSLSACFVEWLQRDKPHALQLPCSGLWRWRASRWMLYYGLLLLLLFCHGEQTEFIYFQF